MMTTYHDEDITDLPLFEKSREKRPRPFVKWVGGKRNLLAEIRAHFPATFTHYYEPFVGGGAVFFAIYERLSHAFLSDINVDLMITYRVIQTHPQALIDRLQQHARQHCKEHYYHVRAQHRLDDEIERAARFLYLNKTCYNGLYRVNKAGNFNTPMGSYKNPNIVQEDNIWGCHQALQHVNLQIREFDTIQPQAGDFVYFDPPYHPTNEISFTEYTSLNFTEEDQRRLAQFAAHLHKKNVYVMISNSKTPFIEEVYNDAKIFRQHEVLAPRYVNCKPGERGAISELLITTFDV